MYDFKVNGKKVQEKYGTPSTKTKSLIRYCIARSHVKGSGTEYSAYKKGDNDFYWFHFPDKNIFYVLPEDILINNGNITVDDKEGKADLGFTVDFKKKVKDYLFHYNIIGDPTNDKHQNEVNKLQYLLRQ